MSLTLEVCVTDQITVFDVISKIEGFVKHFIAFFAKKKKEPIKKQETKGPEKGRAPPALGVKVSDTVRSREALGGK